MQTLNELQQKRTELFNDFDRDLSADSIKAWQAKVQEIDAQISELQTIALLERVNREQSNLRDLAKQCYDCETPTEDVITNSGEFHKGKAKKYPKLAALKYARFEQKDNRITEITIGGKRFYMLKANHEYGKQSTYTRPETFTDFLKYNNIHTEEITCEQFAKFSEQLKEANEELGIALARYNSTIQKLGTHHFAYLGLAGQESIRQSKYTPNTK